MDHPCAQTYASFRLIGPCTVPPNHDIFKIVNAEHHPKGKHVLLCLATQKYVQSKELEDHLKYILKGLEPYHETLDSLPDHTRNISVYWLSSHGHGGPEISAETMKALGNLGISLWIDCYYMEQISYLEHRTLQNHEVIG